VSEHSSEDRAEGPPAARPGEAGGRRAGGGRAASLFKLALRLVGPALLAVVLLRLKDAGQILRAWSAAEPWPLAAAVVLTFANIELKILRWDVLLRTQGIRYPQLRAWAAYLGSAYVALVTPGRVGDALRAQYLRHDQGVGYADGLASVVMDRLCDLYVLAVIAAVGVARFSSILVGRLAWVAWGTVALTILGPLLLLVPGVAERLLGKAYAKLAGARFGKGAPIAGERQDAGAGLARFLEALRSNVGPSLAVTIPLTVGAFLINYLQAWLLARALHLELSFFDLMCLLSIASLLGLLPISVSGVGVRELFFALAFPVLGYAAEQGVSFGLLVFAVLYLVLVVVGFVSWQVAPPPFTAAGAAGSGPDVDGAGAIK
jgi:hypothetical protein